MLTSVAAAPTFIIIPRPRDGASRKTSAYRVIHSRPVVVHLVATPQMTYLYESGFPVVVDVYETTSVKSAAKGVSTMAPVYAEEVSVNLPSASIVPGLAPCVPSIGSIIAVLVGAVYANGVPCNETMS